MAAPRLVGPPLLTRLWRRLVSPDILFSLATGGGIGALLSHGSRSGMLIGVVLARLAYSALALEQVVPFSKRRHVILLPVRVELILGHLMFEQFRLQQRIAGKLVPESDRAHKLVNSIADKIIAAVQLGRGGGFQAHIPRFQWEVIVVREDTANAFVMPGGKIVVYTGLIALMKQDPDLLAMVMAHEVSHALARHSNERIGFGLCCALMTQAVVSLLTASQPATTTDKKAAGKKRRGKAGRMHYTQEGLVAGTTAGDEEEEEEEEDEEQEQEADASVPFASSLGETQRPRWLSPNMLSVFTTIFLQLPFSRRAEAEADLLGLKLMHLAGYNTNKGPVTFELLAKAAPQTGEAAGGQEEGTFLSALAAASRLATEKEADPSSMTARGGDLMAAAVNLGCTHPRGATRVRLLKLELEQGLGRRDGWDAVHVPMDYWTL